MVDFTPSVDPLASTRPWERMAREGDSAWALFQAYRDLGWPNGLGGGFKVRTVRALAEMAGMNEDHIGQVSRSFHWAQRAGAWDREVCRRRDEAGLSEVQRIRARQVTRLAKLHTLMDLELDKMLARASDPDLPQLSASDMAKMAEFVTKYERLLAGESTENVAHAGVWDLERLSIEELAELDRLRRKAMGGG